MQGEEDTPTPPHLLPVLSELVYWLTIKGHSQLMHMRIRYHFLADYTQRLRYVHLVLVEDFDFKKSVLSKHDLCLSVWCPTFQQARAARTARSFVWRASEKKRKTFVSSPLYYPPCSPFLGARKTKPSARQAVNVLSTVNCPASPVPASATDVVST